MGSLPCGQGSRLPRLTDKPFPSTCRYTSPSSLLLDSLLSLGIGVTGALVLQVICGKCSEFKAENGRQSRVCGECFLTQPVAPSSPSLEETLEPKQSPEVGGLGEPSRHKTPEALTDCAPSTVAFPGTRTGRAQLGP